MTRSSSSGSASRAGRAARVVGLTFALIALAAGAAAAKKRVVVLPFSGPAAGQAEGAVTRVIKRRHSIVPAGKFTGTQKRLNLRKPTDRNVAKVSARLKVDAVVVGGIERARGKFKLTVRVREGRSGGFVDTVTVPLRTRRVTQRDERVLADKLLPIIDDLPAVDSGEGEEVADERPARGGRGRRGGGDDEVDDEDEGGGDDEADGEDEEEEEEEEPTRTASREEEEREEEPREAPAERDEPDEPEASDAVIADRKVRGRGVDIAAGLTVVGRNFAFTVRDGLMNKPNGYEGGMVPGAFVTAELYPLAMDPKKGGALRDLGVALVVDKVLKIESKVQGSEEVIPTSQLRWGIGARYRINFGNKPTSPSLKLGVGYNKLTFEIDKDAAMTAGLTVDLPNVAYTYFDPGAQIRFPVSPQLALVGEAKYLYVTATGEVQEPEQYGGATVSGVDVDVGIDYRIGSQWVVRAGGRYLAIAFDFDGTGDLSNNRDGDASSVDVGGALDRYLGGYFTAGYLF